MFGKINFGTVAPSFIILGVQKGGTTSLFKYLLQHQRIIAPKTKELHYFDTLNDTPKSTYLKNFPKRYLTKEISFEATPRYLYFPGTAEKIKKYNRKLKFIVVLRDPVQRAFSAWNMYRQMGESENMQKFFLKNEQKNPKEKIHTFFVKQNFPSFTEWINFELGLTNQQRKELIEPSIVRRGYYKKQIIEYLNFFKREQFMFVNSDDLLEIPQQVLKDIFIFLNLKDVNVDTFDLTLSHKRSYSSKMDSDAKIILDNHYRIKNQGLNELVDLNLSWNL